MPGVLNFMRLLRAVDHGLHRRSKQMAATLSVTGPQRLVIRLAARYPPATAGELAQMLHVHPSTLTGVLQRPRGPRDPAARAGIERRPPRARFRVTPRGRKIDVLRTGTAEALVTRRSRRWRGRPRRRRAFAGGDRAGDVERE